jgi:peptidoglycan hydrolase-like protein with peptidoglycan-binding domain
MGQGQGMKSHPPSNAEVKKVQHALSKKGMHVKADGMYGPSTINAVKKFQRKHHIPATGTLNQKTLKALGVQSQ